MRTLTFGIQAGGEVFRASMSLTDDYFTDAGLPKWHLLNSRFSSPNILWDRPIGAVLPDEPVVNAPQQPPSVRAELEKLREVVAALEKKFDGVR